MRCAHFKVAGRFDGAPIATVTIEYHGPALAFIRIRPYRRRRAFEMSLPDVARGIIFDVVKAERKQAKVIKRGRR